MRYQCEIEINLPWEEVIQKIDSTENIYRWQKVLISHEFIEADLATNGAKMELYYKMGKREIAIIGDYYSKWFSW